MKKFSAGAVSAALLALAVLPLQQAVLAYRVRSGGETKAPNCDFPEEGWSEGALSGNAAGVVLMAVSRLNKHSPGSGGGWDKAAEAWLKFGVFRLRAPSVMLFYGDMLSRRGEKEQALRLYRFSLKRARSENAPPSFIRALERRLGDEK